MSSGPRHGSRGALGGLSTPHAPSPVIDLRMGGGDPLHGLTVHVDGPQDTCFVLSECFVSGVEMDYLTGGRIPRATCTVTFETRRPIKVRPWHKPGTGFDRLVAACEGMKAADDTPPRVVNCRSMLAPVVGREYSFALELEHQLKNARANLGHTDKETTMSKETTMIKETPGYFPALARRQPKPAPKPAPEPVPEPVPEPDPGPDRVTTFFYNPELNEYGVQTNHKNGSELLLDTATYFAALRGKKAEAHMAGWLDHVTRVCTRLGRSGDGTNAHPSGEGNRDARFVAGHVVNGVTANA